MTSKRRSKTSDDVQGNSHGDSEGSAVSHLFGEVANRASHAAGQASIFILALCMIVTWAVTGPIFGFSDTWQLIINTGTTIVTFLMVFLIQNSQNRDSAALQVKLDELIRASAAQNKFVGIEHLTDEELEDLRNTCEQRAKTNKGKSAEENSTRSSARDRSRHNRVVKRINQQAKRAADAIQR